MIPAQNRRDSIVLEIPDNKTYLTKKGKVLAENYYKELLKHLIINGLKEQTQKYIYTLSDILNLYDENIF